MATKSTDFFIKYKRFTNNPAKYIYTWNENGSCDIYLNTSYPPSTYKQTISEALNAITGGDTRA